MQPFHRFALAWTVASVAILAAGQDAAMQPRGAVSVTAGRDAPLDVLRQWDAAVDSLSGAANSCTLRAAPTSTSPRVLDGVPVLGVAALRASSSQPASRSR